MPAAHETKDTMGITSPTARSRSFIKVWRRTVYERIVLALKRWHKRDLSP